MKRKKLGMYVTATTLSFGLLASPALAETTNANVNPNVNERTHPIEIRVAAIDDVVSKTELIKKFKQLFPGKYDFLKESDFHLSSAHYYPDDETIRYDLSFYKKVSGDRYLHGWVVFAGDNLEVENLYLDSLDEKEALFPAKISKEEAKNIATKFVEKFASGSKYQLQEDVINYYGWDQLLTEPIRYSFSFVRTENGIPIPEQTIDVVVLGNGDITQMYRSSEFAKATFDDYSNVKSKEEMLNQMKDNLSLQLQYLIDYDYLTGENKVDLIYKPSIQNGVNALTGQWVVGSEFQSKLPTNKKIEMLVDKSLPAKYQGVTVEEAKQLAQQLLKVDSKNVKLSIDSIEETTNYRDQEVIEVSYSYSYDRGGYGTSLTIDKNTGDILDYYNSKDEVLKEIGEAPKNAKKVTKEQALAKAIEYLKQYSPSKLKNYAKPIEEPIVDEWSGGYIFSFPRIVNGIPVVGDEISVTISEYGNLRSLYVNQTDVEDWPQLDQAVSEEEAKNKILNSLNAELHYVKMNEQPHYSLVYTPVYNGNSLSYFDAISGEWKTPSYIQEPIEEGTVKVSHPTAEKELNYFIEKGYLEIPDVENFDANAPITKGEVLTALVKSLSYYGVYYYEDMEDSSTQSFENIGPDHPYYGVIEQAVSMGILNPNGQGFDPDSTITREQLAVWYIRTLGLEQTAKNADIFKINAQDASEVNASYTGYVALANSFGLITAENGVMNPKGEVTYADFVTSAVRLAHKANEMNVEFY